MPWSNWGRLAAALTLIALLGGCGTSQVRRAEPIRVELPEAKPLQRQFSPEIQQRYKDALSLIREEQYIPAQQALESLLAEDPEIAGAWYNLALLQYRQQDQQGSLRSLDHCLALSPRNPAAHTLNGLILRQQGQFKSARIAYAKALESDQNYASAYLNLAILYDIYLQYFEDALIHYQRYLALAGEGEQPEQVKLWIQDLQLRMAQGSQR
tara:strand:+ start:9005 stop:9637 length:633 start_codon:yes stop_codon:yes gene_type:complete